MPTRRGLLSSILAATVIAMLNIAPASAEAVMVKYHGMVTLDKFDCTTVSRSSFVKRVCYERSNAYMVILLGSTYYHYCGIPSAVVRDLLSAESAGRYYNAAIKGRYDCRNATIPKY